MSSRPSRRWGHGAAAWAGGFAALHLYWAVGGTVGLAESAGSRLAAERPAAFVVAGLYGVGLLLLAGCALGVLLARRPVPGPRRVLPLVGAAVATVLLLRAVVVELLLLTDAGYGGGAVSADQRFWSLVLWNPWFLLGGIAFALTAVAAHRSPARPDATGPREPDGPRGPVGTA